MKNVNLLKKVGLVVLTLTLIVTTVASVDQSPVQAGIGCGCHPPRGGGSR